MVVWSALGLVNSAWRVAFYHSKSNGKKTTGPYRILISSTRSRDLMHDNPTGDILSNDYVELTFVCHASSMMYQLPNNVIHTLVKINGYTENVHRFLVDLDGVEICGFTIEIPQEWKDMTYFFKLGKIPGYGCNEAEYAARAELLAKNMAAFKEQRDLGRLASILAKKCSNFECNVDLSELQVKADSGDLVFEDEKDLMTFNKLYEKYQANLWDMLADKREQQLEQYENNTNFKETADLKHLAAVFFRIYGDLNDLQSKVDINDPKLEEEKDLATFKLLYKTYDTKLWDMLSDKREQHLKQFENNTSFKLHNDMLHVASQLRKYHRECICISK